MHFPVVEPVDGPEIERLVTVLLNVTGVMKHIIEATPAFTAHGYDADGLEVIAQAAAQTRHLLAGVVEHHDDEELAYIRHFLTVVTVVLAHETGTSHYFQPPNR